MSDDRRARLRALTPEQRRAALLKARAASTGAETSAIRHEDRPRAVLSFAQERQWFLWKLSPTETAYSVPVALRIHGAVDVDALKQAFRRLSTRHQILRTVYVSHGDAVVAERTERGIELDVVTVPADRLRERIRGEIARPFDLEAGPVGRATLFATGRDEHVMLLVMHHIATDGWSLGIMIRELSELYRTEHEGQPATLPELEIQYADFATWQRETLAGASLETLLAFWKRTLAGSNPLELPLDHPRPNVAGFAGASEPLRLSRETTTKLRALATEAGATLFMVLGAAYAQFLGKLSGQRDLSFGTPVAGRSHAELEPLLGFFVNTVVLRFDVAPSRTFRAAIDLAKSLVLDAFAHGNAPFEKIVEAISPDRDPSRAPLFQTLFALQNAPSDALRVADLTFEGMPLDLEHAQFELSLMLTETSEGGLDGVLTYRTDLFAPETAKAFAERFVALTGALADHPAMPVSALPLATAAERTAVLARSAALVKDVDDEGAIHEVFDEAARRFADRVALRFEGASLSYREVRARALSLATTLRARGVGPDVNVGLFAERSFELVVGALAILYAGGAYVPLDPSYPADRLQYVLADARVHSVLTAAREIPPWLTEAGVPLVDVRGVRDEPPASELSAARPACHPDQAAYVIYTSGSTGKPKGVVISHRNVLRLMRGTEPLFHFSADDVGALFHSFAFDFSVWELWASLLYGGTLVVVPYLVSRSSTDFLRLITEERVTLLNQTPSAFRQLVATLRTSRETPALALREVVFGGEALDLRSLSAWYALGYGSTRLVNMYGITETTVHVTYRPLEPADASSPFSLVGAPLSDLSTFVLDESLEPLPDGVFGELYVAGPGLSRGYLARPELTAERFVPNPFGAPGSRLYKSGDIARFHRGELEFLGRRDHQIKLRGHRIELGEIEAAILTHPRISQALVKLSGSGDDASIVAWFVPKTGESVEFAEVRQHVGQHLPDIMVPAAGTMIDAFPLTPNGKLDVGALPKPLVTTAPFAEPRSQEEIAIAKLWEELLSVPRVGRNDDFFALGGHSLLATRFVAKLEGRLGRKVPLRAVFDAPTVSRLALALADADAHEVAPIPRLPRDGQLPLSFAQERMWFLTALEPESTAYHLPLVLQIEGALDVDALSGAVRDLAERHETLRTVYPSVDGSPAARVTDDLLSVDVTSGLLSPSEVKKLVQELVDRPFDLRTGPVARASLLKLADRSYVFAFVVHHVALDQWSFDVLANDLAELYAAHVEKRPDRLTPLSVQVPDFAAWQREVLDGARVRADVDFWRRALTGFDEPLALPTDKPRPPVVSAKGIEISFSVPHVVASSIKSLAQDLSATPFVLWTALFALWLSKEAGQRRVVVGSPVTERQHPDLQGVVGLLTNTVAIPVLLDANGTLEQLFRDVRGSVLDAFSHQGLPFEKLVQELGVPRSLDRSPIFQAMLVFLPASQPLSLPGASVSLFELEAPAAKFDLLVSLVEQHDGSLAGLLQVPDDLFDRPSVERLAKHFLHLAACASPTTARGKRLESFSLLDLAERARVLATARGRLAERGFEPIHAAIGRAAAARPDAVALSFEGTELTYRDLWQRSGVLARRLHELGIRPDDRVAILMERSLELLVALVAVLRSGGAYVPLDPTYPRDRIDFMLRDAAAKVVLSQPRVLESFPELRDACSNAEGRTVLSLDAAAASFARGDAFDVPALAPSSLAYVIYTSGSTGTPKGCENSHAAVLNRLAWGQDTFALSHEDIQLQKTPISFDVSVYELFWAIRAGARLVIARPDGHKEPLYLADLIERERISVVHFVPSMLDAFLASVSPARCRTVRLLFTSGEALPAPVAAEAKRRGYDVENLYGPTEAAVEVSRWAVPSDPARVLLGRPVDNTQLYVLDTSLEPVPTGVTGELFIAGVQVGRGYVDRPSLTAERFLPDPFGPPGARMYRTGDLARYDNDEQIHYLGRADFQVKVRGFRVELGEIEAALRVLGGVRDAAVLLRGEILVAYLVGDIGVDDARSALGKSLPAHMIPSAFVFLDAFPLSPAGKLDRRALPDPDFGSEIFEAPVSQTEIALATIWQELLSVSRVGRHDDFFALGGHSLLATRLVASVARSLGVVLALRTVFENGSLAALAASIDAGSRTAPSALASIPRVPRDGPLSLSFAQERMWFLHQLEPESTAYHVPLVLRIDGELDVGALAAAVEDLSRRHETLRTVYPAVGAVPAAIVADATIPLTLHADPVSLGVAERIVQQRIEQPFDLLHGPVARAALLSLDDGAHLLVFVAHHIALDQWSFDILASDLAELYSARLGQRPHDLPDLDIQVADFAAWQRERVASDEGRGQLAFWRSVLSGAPELLSLPADHERPAVMSYRGANQPFAVPPEIATGIAALAKQASLTGFGIWVGLFALWLSKESGQSSVVVGSPVTDRHHHDLQGIVGFLTNTIPIHVRVDDDRSLLQFLDSTRTTVLDALASSIVPFEHLVQELVRERALDRSPLFQAMLTYLPASPALSLGSSRISPFAFETTTTKFDLLLSLTENDDGSLQGNLQFSSDLFERSTIERFLDHFLRLAARVAGPGATSTKLAQLSFLSEADLAFVDEASRGPRDAPAEPLLSSFKRFVSASPRALAFCDGDTSLSYLDVDTISDRIAHALQRRGAGIDSTVAVSARRSHRFWLAVLAVAKLGATVLPIDPTYPRDRISFALRSARADFVCTERDFADRFSGTPIVDIDAGASALVDDAPPFAHVSPHPDSVLYVLFTSGSTGTPKGVAVTHRCITNLLAWERARSHRRPLHTAQFTSPSFDVSFQEVFGAWTSGASLELVSEEQRKDPALLFDLLDSKGVERLYLPFVALAQLAHVTSKRGAAPRALKEIITAGEALLVSKPIVELFRLSGASLDNQYGPTESHVVSQHRLLGPPETWPASPPIGRPISNARMYILSDALTRVAPGAIGELFLAGDALARGYVQRPDLSAERFLPDPFGPPGARMYRTGDLARFRSDGAIEFLGRKDHQVKVRGYRIELGEIESLLASIPSVKEVACSVVGSSSEEKRLVAYLVFDAPDVDRELERAKDLVSSKLPEHMLPSAWILLDALPLLPSGKVDRRNLPIPSSAASADNVPPRTDLERSVAEAFAELLGLTSVGVLDDFFALGGHSLLATRLVARLEASLRRSIPLRALFENPSVETFARFLERSDGSFLAPIPRISAETPPPLSFAQERMWFLHQLEPDSPFYNMPIALRMLGGLDTDALARAFDDIVRRHDVLRTVFASEGGALRQVVIPADTASVLQTEDVAGDDAEILARAEHEASSPFDLQRGPLFRARLLRRSENEHVLLVTMHHVVSDAWSLGVLVRELVALYDAHVHARAPSLPELSIQYADFAAWQRATIRGARLAEQLDFWKNALREAPSALELLADFPRPPIQTYRGATVPFGLSAETTSELRALVAAHGATLFMVLLAAYAVVLGRHTRQLDLVIGTPIANRRRAEIEPLLGCFVNTLPLRVRFDVSSTFDDVIARAKKSALDAFEHQDTPFEMIVEAISPPRDTSRSPLFQAMFSLGNAPETALDVEGVSFEPLDSQLRIAKFELSLDVIETREGSIEGVIEYNTDLFARASMEALSAHLSNFLDAAVRSPRTRALALPIASPREHELVARWGTGTPLRPASSETLDGLFVEQALRAPEAIALVCHDGQSLTYRELDAQSDLVCEGLRRHGISVGSRVAIFIERSAHAIIALLGTLKAGAAYVPLDPSAPASRLETIAADVRPAATLTSRQLRGKAPTSSAPVIEIELFLEASATSSVRAHARHSALLPAYVIYTSGSTGLPKGVAISHRNAVSHVLGLASTSDFARTDRVLQFASLAFDASVEEIFGALCHGATLVLRSDAVLSSSAAFVDECRVQNITVLDLPTAFWHLLMSDLVAGRIRLPETVRLVILGGERPQPTHVAAWATALGSPARLLNSYGPTEATIAPVVADVTSFDGSAEAPIGRPVPNATAWVLDDDLRPAGVTVPGELFIGGDAVAIGYLGRSDLTGERFVPDPFSARPGARMYRTGDLARWRPDGALELRGRIDRQVKIRGFRVELEEIESVLARHSAVSDVAVSVFERAGDKRLAAFVVLSPSSASLSDSDVSAVLREHAKEHLPDYMVPSVITTLGALPLTTTGKLDRRALPEPTANTAEFEAPTSPTERVLATLWQDLLDVARVGRNDDFFALGGHSLVTMRLRARFAEETGRHVPLRLFFEETSLAKLASAIDAAVTREPVTPERMRADARFTPDPSFDPASLPTTRGRTVLVTGATGFLGPYVLSRLHATVQPERIVCLGRGSDDASFRARVLAALEKHGLRSAALESVIEGVASNAPWAPSFGLDEERYRELVEEVDTVIHLAAEIHGAKDYDDLHGSNIGFTRRIFAFATTAPAKVVSYASTTSILDIGGELPQRIDSSFIPEPGAGVTSGYAQTKWVAELLARGARAAGLPVAILRFDLLGARLDAPVFPDDTTTQLLIAVAKARSLPREGLEQRLRVLPVDIAATFLVRSLAAGDFGDHFVAHPSTAQVAEIVEAANSRGAPFQLVDELAHWEQLIDEVGGPKSSAFSPIIVGAGLEQRMDTSSFESILSREGERIPAPTELLLAYLEAVGSLR